MSKHLDKSLKPDKLRTRSRSRKKPAPELQIAYRKLGKEKARGQFISDLGLIEIDERLTGEEHLEVLIHESLHALQPHHDELTVARDAVNLAHILWFDGYRKTV
jgi:hypothetical protein